MKYLFFIIIIFFYGCLNNVDIKEECKKDKDCLNGFTCNDNHECVKFICSSDKDCRVGEICENSECITGCRRENNCKDDKICNLDTLKCEKKVTCIDDSSICKEGYICDIESKKCKLNNNCITKNDCPDNYDCINNLCKKHKCINDESCGNGNICENDSCVIGCRKDKDCKNYEECNQETFKCDDKPDCRDNSSICNSKQNCNKITGVCELKDCRDEDVCEHGYECKISTGKCELVTCTISSDCPNNYDCKDQNCIKKIKCNNDEQCVIPGERCRVNGYCGIDTGCDSDQYCLNKDITKPYCNNVSLRCYECVIDAHCPLEGDSCDQATHKCKKRIICENDSDCGLNRRCDKNVNPHKCVNIFENECEVNSDCLDSSKPLCSIEANPKVCVQCLLNSDCTDDQFCYEKTICEKIECVEDEDCNILNNEKCDNNICIEKKACSEDVPCIPGEICSDGYCEKIDCSTQAGMFTCLMINGTCNGATCTPPVDPCEGVSCSEHSTCSNGNCNCDDGYKKVDDKCVQL